MRAKQIETSISVPLSSVHFLVSLCLWVSYAGRGVPYCTQPLWLGLGLRRLMGPGLLLSWSQSVWLLLPAATSSAFQCTSHGYPGQAAIALLWIAWEAVLFVMALMFVNSTDFKVQKTPVQVLTILLELCDLGYIAEPFWAQDLFLCAK